ncbi:MAG: tetratricopeptide repeat protein, partial [Gammaproteobacteria bacterium]|nr:tetratricopeptide repeat protein [Gammaproteobacteria bacterium]
VLNALERFDAASDAYKAGLAMNERLFGEDNSYALYFVNGLGKVAEARGDLETAVSYYSESRRLIVRDMPESPNLAFVTANIGKVHMLQGDFESALPLYRSALKIFEEKLPNHWARGGVSWRLGLCLVETGNYADAEPLILAGIEIVENQWGPDHELTQSAREAAARLYGASDKPGQVDFR